MPVKKVMWFGAVGMLVAVLVTGVCFAQVKAGTSPTAPAKSEVGMETIKGTIDYTLTLGGYFIRGKEPGGEFFIVNQNPEVLKKLKESGKTVTFEGRTAERGAEYFFIQKIDGKKYSGTKKQ